MSDELSDLFKTFVIMSPEKKASPESFSATFYEDLDQKYGDFKGHELIAAHEFSDDWPTWEMHPKGDEVVILLSGEATFILKKESADQSVILNQPGAFVIVPKGIWHTAKVSVKTRMLFITPGEGTLNREIPPPAFL